VIFEVKTADAGKITTIIKDDLIGRQSIVIRDANSLDVKGEVSYLKIEGSKEGLQRAEELAKELGLKKLSEKKATTINKKIEAQEDSAATGMGMIFD
jgi:hypothetical protein